MPWGDNTPGQGPWGNGGNNNSGGSKQPPQPDIDELIRKSRDQFKQFFGNDNKKSLLILILVGLVLWLSTGIYTIEPGEVGVVKRFGAYSRKTEPGINYHIPKPFEEVVKVPVEQINTINIGFRSFTTGRLNKDNKVLEESLMLTVHRNIAEVPFAINWKVSSPEDFLFNVRDPGATIKSVAESGMREIVARNTFGDVIAGGKDRIAHEAKDIMQEMLDDYNAGILITQLNMRDVQPPAEVVDAFIDVEDAKQDRDKAIEQARAYQNDVIPRARGEAQKILEQARAYKQEVTAKAEGEADRFTSIYDKYKVAKDVTRKRMYLETMEEVLKGKDKILLDNKGGSGVLPYLPINELNKQRTTN